MKVASVSNAVTVAVILSPHGNLRCENLNESSPCISAPVRLERESVFTDIVMSNSIHRGLAGWTITKSLSKVTLLSFSTTSKVDIFIVIGELLILLSPIKSTSIFIVSNSLKSLPSNSSPSNPIPWLRNVDALVTIWRSNSEISISSITRFLRCSSRTEPAEKIRKESESVLGSLPMLSNPQRSQNDISPEKRRLTSLSRAISFSSTYMSIVMSTVRGEPIPLDCKGSFAG